MTHTSYKSGIALLMLALFALTIPGFWGCADNPADNNEPFVRLLENETIHSGIFGRDISYAVLLPENYNMSGDSFPVVYLLHGYGDEYTVWYKYGLIEYYSDLYADENVPMIFVMPQGFNTYYVNRYNGNLPYMDFFISELVPEIDSIYRTKKSSAQRAVMGYSMGGYGALILPAKNPDVFGTGIPLSMSFRTDSQYMTEPQDVFDSQWGITFGGYGTSGEARLTDYFKAHSPFHFFDQNDLSEYTGLRLLLDCGDDEETLSVTNGALHNLMMERKIPHAYRVRNGGHSWDYWHQSLHEALNFVSHGFQGTVYPEDPEPVPVGDLISPDRYIIESIEGTDLQIGIFKPSAYDSDTVSYPVIFFIHDFEGSSRSESAIQLLSFLNNNMTASRIPNSIVVEIPAGQDEITTGVMSGIIDHINAHYRIVADKKGKVFLGNEKGAADVCLLIPDFREIFNACFLFDAQLEQDVEAESGMYYYLDLVDQSDNYQGNYDLYLDLREKGNNHEYRIRRGLPAIQSFINGLDGSMSYLSQKLKGQ